MQILPNTIENITPSFYGKTFSANQSRAASPVNLCQYALSCFSVMFRLPASLFLKFLPSFNVSQGQLIIIQ